MKVIFRGGPHDRKRMEINGTPIAYETMKAPKIVFNLSEAWDGPMAVDVIRGRYSRTVDPTKKGIYYMVWMGWDE